MLVAGLAHAQTLQHRASGAADASTTRGPAAPVSSIAAGQAFPVEAEGEYRWREPDEVIELYFENGALRGYLTRRSERGKADSAPMTFAFAEASAAGGTLSFTTRHIHGDWYSFKGRVVRGPVTSRSLDGYYLLRGTLATHLGPAGPGDESASDEPLTREVALKLAGSRHGAG